jgi:hypothetical protein
MHAIKMIAVAVGSLKEIPNDPKGLTDLYFLTAQVEWHEFNSAVQGELDKKAFGLRLRSRKRVLRRHQKRVRKRVEKQDPPILRDPTSAD